MVTTLERSLLRCALIALAMLAGCGESQPLAPVGPVETGDVRVNDPNQQFPGDQKVVHEPHLAIDPTRPDNIIAFAVDLSVQNLDPKLHFQTDRSFRSTDGGRSWADRGPMRYAVDNVVWDSGDPVAAFAPDGTAYFASLARPPDSQQGFGGTWVHRSDDGGATWNLPVLVAPNTHDANDVCNYTDKEWISVEPQTGDVLLTWHEFKYDCAPGPVPDPVGVTDFVRIQGFKTLLARSSDRGQTWSAPQTLWQNYALGATPKTGPGGELYVVFWSSLPMPNAPFSSCPSLTGTLTLASGGNPFGGIVVMRSLDRGRTWEPYVQRSACDNQLSGYTKPGAFAGGTFLPSFTVDPGSGAAFVAYAEYVVAQNRYTIQMISSHDAGASWSQPSDATSGTDDARDPAVFAKDGGLWLAYVGSRADGTADTFLQHSGNGGATWSKPLKISSVAAQLGDNPDVGDYIGIDMVGERISVIWTDARDGARTQIRSWTGPAPR